MAGHASEKAARTGRGAAEVPPGHLMQAPRKVPPGPHMRPMRRVPACKPASLPCSQRQRPVLRLLQQDLEIQLAIQKTSHSSASSSSSRVTNSSAGPLRSSRSGSSSSSSSTITQKSINSSSSSSICDRGRH